MKWFDFPFGVHIINRNLHAHLEIPNLSSCVEKYFTSEHTEEVKLFSTLEEKSCLLAPLSNTLYLLH